MSDPIVTVERASPTSVGELRQWLESMVQRRILYDEMPIRQCEVMLLVRDELWCDGRDFRFLKIQAESKPL